MQTENTVSDSLDLYYGLFMYNVFVAEQASPLIRRTVAFSEIMSKYRSEFSECHVQMDKLDRAFEDVKRMLYGRLHGVMRKHFVERVPMPGAPSLASTEARDSPAANREEMKPLPPRIAAVPSPCHTFSPVAFSTAKC